MFIKRAIGQNDDNKFKQEDKKLTLVFFFFLKTKALEGDTNMPAHLSAACQL